MRAHYETMIRDNDRKVKKALRIQNRDAQSAFCGASRMRTGCITPDTRCIC